VRGGASWFCLALTILSISGDPPLARLCFRLVEGLGEAGLEKLLTTLEDVGAGKVALSVDDARPDNARHLARLCLQGAREEGWSFEQAWSTAMARLQPSQAGGEVNPVEAAELREDRRLLEEDRPLFQAAYEGREPTTMERAQRLAAVGNRLDEAFRPAPAPAAPMPMPGPTLSPVDRALAAV